MMAKRRTNTETRKNYYSNPFWPGAIPKKHPILEKPTC